MKRDEIISFNHIHTRSCVSSERGEGGTKQNTTRIRTNTKIHAPVSLSTPSKNQSQSSVENIAQQTWYLLDANEGDLVHVLHDDHCTQDGFALKQTHTDTYTHVCTSEERKRFRDTIHIFRIKKSIRINLYPQPEPSNNDEPLPFLIGVPFQWQRLTIEHNEWFNFTVHEIRETPFHKAKKSS